MTESEPHGILLLGRGLLATTMAAAQCPSAVAEMAWMMAPGREASAAWSGFLSKNCGPRLVKQKSRSACRDTSGSGGPRRSVCEGAPDRIAKRVGSIEGVMVNNAAPSR